MSEKTILAWFRNDLRLHDNEILSEASRKADRILPVYCFDPNYFQRGPSGALRTGSIRARFLLESVADLRQNLRAAGADLLVRCGDPAEIIPSLAQEFGVTEVYHHREVAPEETMTSEAVEAALWKIRLNLKHFIGHTLYHKEDLPFPIRDIPDNFAVFKRKIERESEVRACLETPLRLHCPYIPDPGDLPGLDALGLSEPPADARALFHYQGGETAAFSQLSAYLSALQPAAGQRGLKRSPEPSRLSAWISMGCLSQRLVFHRLAELAGQGQAASSALALELLRRDYFRFMFKKHGRQFCNPGGFKAQATKLAAGAELQFSNWKDGRTGIPHVDAAMHQLNATGYIGNHNRRMVASFLVRELKGGWKEGAAYFQERLIDYSPASNWGNWCLLAGVGNGSADGRVFSPQSTDPEQESERDLIRTWMPAGPSPHSLT